MSSRLPMGVPTR